MASCNRWYNRRMKKLVYVVIGILIVSNVVLWNIDFSDELEVIFFNIGQGDSIFIEIDNYQVLIDGGPGSAVLEKLGEEMAFYDKTIDLVVLTHPDSDHLSGLLEVLKRYNVENILWTGVVKDSADYEEWLNLIKNTNIIIASAGQRIDLPDNAYLITHYPFESLEGEESSNDTSIVTELIFDDVSFLFTGDISQKIEKQLDIDSDILKVAHHGSKTSSCSEFIEKVSPEVAVISVGENNWGHPSPEVLSTLSKFGIHTLITKEINDVKIVSDGNNFSIK